MDRPRAAAGYTRASIPRPGRNRANERESRDYLGHGWGFAWPADRRILYNRASARPDGTPWSERKKLVWWDAAKREWTGLDVPDFIATKAPDYQPPPDAHGDEALRGDDAVPHAPGRPRLDVGADRACATARCRRITSRSSRRCSNALYPDARDQSAGGQEGAPGQCLRADRRSRVSRTC